MDIPEDLRYTREHEWVKLDKSKKVATIGITDYAQEKLGDVVFVELPEEGDTVERSQPFGSIESVKAVSDLFAPITGTIVEVNDTLMDSPEIVNDDVYTEAWMVKIKVEEPTDIDGLMTAAEYKEFLAAEEEG